MRQVALELIDRRPDEPGSTVPLDLDDEYVGFIAVFELDTSVDGIAASEPVVVANRTGLQVGDMAE